MQYGKQEYFFYKQEYRIGVQYGIQEYSCVCNTAYQRIGGTYCRDGGYSLVWIVEYKGGRGGIFGYSRVYFVVYTGCA